MTLCRTITPKLFLSHRLCLSGQNMSSRSLHRTTLAQPVAAKRLMNFTSNGKERRRQRQSGRVSPRQSLNPLLSLAFNKCLILDGEPTERQRKKDLFLGKHTSARHKPPPEKPVGILCPLTVCRVTPRCRAAVTRGTSRPLRSPLLRLSLDGSVIRSHVF